MRVDYFSVFPSTFPGNMETGRPAPPPLRTAPDPARRCGSLSRTSACRGVRAGASFGTTCLSLTHTYTCPSIFTYPCTCPYTYTCPCKGAPAEDAAQHFAEREHEVPLEQPRGTQQPSQGPAQALRWVWKPSKPHADVGSRGHARCGGHNRAGNLGPRTPAIA
ncbi:hypothetical protein B484DRAFT_447267 [Ochromonadaceae sp. CCMP2298]|nr:hypothetical protein B484DRAFT_447267 [Ochromonadaceae sp. CCMP2298]